MNPLAAMDVYTRPRTVTDLADCTFYHTQDIPGYGHVEGEWDLRSGIRSYLGEVDVAGKRVLELGSADGFISFYLEQQGAAVVSYDLSPDDRWDIVPFARLDHRAFARIFMAGMPKVNNAYWLCHRAHQSRARMVHGDIYSIPDDIGPFD